LAVDGVASDRGIDGGVWFIGDAVDEGEVDFCDIPAGKLAGEVLVAEFIFGDDEATAGIFVEAVDDARAFRSADIPEFIAVVQEGVDEGALFVAHRRMDDHSAGFVDDHQVVVFVENGQGDFFGEGFGCGFRRRLDFDDVAGVEVLFRFGGGAIEQDGTIFNEELQA